MATWKKLKSEKTYKEALSRIDALLDVKRSEAMQNELMLLSYLVSEYESEYKAIPDASPLEVIRFMMEMKGIQQKDLVPLMGSKGFVSKILSGKAALQLDMVHKLSSFLGIPIEALIPKSDVQIKEIEEKTQYVAEPAITPLRRGKVLRRTAAKKTASAIVKKRNKTMR